MLPRHLAPIALGTGLLAVCVQPDAALATARASQPAAAALAAARAAIGVGEEGRAVRSLELNGRLRVRNQWYGQLPGREWTEYALEIKALLPDHYLRIASRTSEGPAMVRRAGFSGATLLNRIERPGAVQGSAAQAPGWDPLLSERQTFARLMLLVALRTDTPFPLALRPQGSSDATLEFTGRDGFTVHVDLDPRTRVPLRLRQQIAARAMDGRLTGDTRDFVMEASDRREISGVRLPFLISSRSGPGGEEIRLDSVRLNTPLRPEDFKP
jgi:hypothetical protein